MKQLALRWVLLGLVPVCVQAQTATSPSCATRLRLRPGQRFALRTMGPDGPLVLVNVHDPPPLITAAKLLEKQGHMNLMEPLVLLK